MATPTTPEMKKMAWESMKKWLEDQTAIDSSLWTGRWPPPPRNWATSGPIIIGVDLASEADVTSYWPAEKVK